MMPNDNNISVLPLKEFNKQSTSFHRHRDQIELIETASSRDWKQSKICSNGYILSWAVTQPTDSPQWEETAAKYTHTIIHIIINLVVVIVE